MLFAIVFAALIVKGEWRNDASGWLRIEHFAGSACLTVLKPTDDKKPPNPWERNAKSIPLLYSTDGPML